MFTSTSTGLSAPQTDKWRAVRNWLIAALGCFVFARIYALFSHGVSSIFMTWMFLIPLIGGAGVYALLRIVAPSLRNDAAACAYNCGLATLTVASTLQGIFEIAGTDSPYNEVMAVVGATLVVIAVVFCAVSRNHCTLKDRI